MQAKPSVRFHQLKPNKKPADNKINNLSPAAAPVDIKDESINVQQSSSRKYRNQSVSEAKNSQIVREGASSRYSKSSDNEDRAKVVQSSKLAKQDEAKSKRQILRLREKVSHLQDQNMSLHKLTIQYESEVKIWQEKARRLNDELINYQNNELKIDLSSNADYYKRELMLKEEEIRQFKMSRLDYEETNRELVEKIEQMLLEMQKNRREVGRLRQVQNNFSKLQSEYLLLKQQLESTESSNYKNQLYISQLERQIQEQIQSRNSQSKVLDQQKIITIKREADQTQKQLQKVIRQLQRTESQKQTLLQRLKVLDNPDKQQIIAESHSQIMKLTRRNEELSLKLLDTQQELDRSNRLLHQSKQQLGRAELAKVSSVQQNSSRQQSLQQRYNEIEYMTDRIREQKKREIEKLQESHKAEVDKLRSEVESMRVKYQMATSRYEELVSRQDSSESGYKSKIEQMERIIDSFNKQIKESVMLSHKERAVYQKKCKEYKELQASNNTLKIQYDQVLKQKVVAQQVMHDLQVELRQLYKERVQLQQSRQQAQKQLIQKIRENQYTIKELIVQNERWKSYRMSEEEEARRQARKHKKRVEELELIFNNEHKHNEQLIEQLQKTNQQLNARLLHQQNQTKEIIEKQDILHMRQLQEEKLQFNAAMDQMEVEFKRLLAECEFKIDEKQKQIDSLSLQLNALSKNQVDREQYIFEKERLNKQLSSAHGEIKELLMAVKGYEEENRAIKQGSQSQRDYKVRHDKNIEQKIRQIQKLKLQVGDLQQQLRRNSKSKQQSEMMEMMMRKKEVEESERVERVKHLEKMIEVSQSQIRAYKSVKQELMAEVKSLQTQVARNQTLSRSVEEMQYDLQQQRNKTSRLVEQKAKLYKQSEQKGRRVLELEYNLGQSDKNIKKWTQRYEKLQRQADSNKDSLKNSSVKQQQLFVLLRESESKLNSMINRVNDLQRQVNSLKDYKKRYFSLQEQQLKDKQTSLHQTQIIQTLTKEQAQKTHQIKILLSKLDSMETQQALTLNRISYSSDNLNKVRMEYFQKIAAVIGKISYDGQEEAYLKTVYEAIRLMMSKQADLTEQLLAKQKMIAILSEQKQNLNNKYVKYKSAALEYKDKKQLQKLLMRNTYRFNEQVLTHCQSIINGNQGSRR